MSKTIHHTYFSITRESVKLRCKPKVQYVLQQGIMIVRRFGALVARQCRTLATTTPISPPRASADQIFHQAGLPRQGTSLGTVDDWEAAIRAQEQGVDDDDDKRDAGEGVDGEREGIDNASLFASNRTGQASLPEPLRTSINEVLREAHGPGIRMTAMRFYEALQAKAEGRSSQVIMPSSKEFTSMEADAYLAGMMPQVYASVYPVLLELRKRLGRDWRPRKVLDCGVGPGTAGLAFNHVFGDENPHRPDKVPEMTVVEAGHELRSRIPRVWSRESNWESTEVHHRMASPEAQHHRYSVILAPHLLGEVKGRPSERDDLVRDLWARLEPNGVLLLLERGHPMGFEQVARARQLLLRQAAKRSEAAHVIAPCPHDGACPMFLHGHQPNRRQWCHFSQRLQRPDFLQRTKHSKSNSEDVTYSYILIRKGLSRPLLPESYGAGMQQANVLGQTAREEIERQGISDRDIVSASYHWSRIVLPPLKRHKHILIDVCAAPDPRVPNPAPPSESSNDEQADHKSEGKEDGRLAAAAAAAAEGERRPHTQRMTVPKSQGQMQYRFARKSHWGDLLPFRGKTVIEKKELDHDATSRFNRKRKIRTRRDHHHRINTDDDL